MVSVSLPSDLVIEILSRVPGKSLARFRSVSKQFRSLFSDPCFIRLHHSHSRGSLFTLKALKDYNIVVNFPIEYFREPTKFYCLRYNFELTNKANDLVHKFTLEFGGFKIRMLSSNHQLLCFACQNEIHLCDPVNKEFLNLPYTSLSGPRVLKTSNERHVSFGFVDATMQYKVVKWPYDLDKDRTRKLPNGLITTWKKVDVTFEVLDIDILEDGCLKVSPWRRVQRPCPYLLQLLRTSTTSDFQVVSFSLQDETFSTLNPKS